MLDPEKLLGGLLRSGLGSRGTGRLLKGGATMALLGVALEAAEHYMKTASPSSTPQPPGRRRAASAATFRAPAAGARSRRWRAPATATAQCGP